MNLSYKILGLTCESETYLVGDLHFATAPLQQSARQLSIAVTSNISRIGIQTKQKEPDTGETIP